MAETGPTTGAGRRIEPRRVQHGDRERTYTMQPCGPSGAPINYGQHYANAHTIGDARAWARAILAKPDGRHLGYPVASVDITGTLYEFNGVAWAPVRGAGWEHEQIVRSQQNPPHAPPGRTGE
jgi:hypothetical protein